MPCFPGFVVSNDRFRNLAGAAAAALGSPKLFAANVCLIALWLISGPFFHYSDTWQLVVNTATTIITYLAVFLIQNTQNRDTKVLQLKLDELILSMEGARNRLVRVEELSDEELELLQKQFERLRRLSTVGAIDPVKAVAAEREAPDRAPDAKPS